MLDDDTRKYSWPNHKSEPDLHLSLEDNNGANNSGNYTPVAEIAREVQKVVEEIEAATGISLTSSAGEEVEETEEPAMKKGKKDDDQNRDHQPPTN